jgi:PilZ domain
MGAGLIHGLLFACRHQFSWPRTDETGANYQVCVHCGAKYSYDWATMRRIAPLAGQEELDARPSARRKCGTKKAWQPRERRLRHCVPVQFRTAGSAEWIEGMTENISRSGLLFRSASPLEVGSGLELIFEMPRELTGDANARVICDGALVRVEAVAATRASKQASFLMACTIAQYRFVPSGE